MAQVGQALPIYSSRSQGPACRSSNRKRNRRCRASSTQSFRCAQALWGLGWRSIQDVPDLSLSIAKRDAKNVSCIGMKI